MCNFVRGHILIELMFTISWRTWIFPIAVLVTNLTVVAMNHDFRFFPDRDFPRSLDCSSLRGQYRGHSFIAFATNSPVFALRYYMLILAHVIPLSQPPSFL